MKTIVIDLDNGVLSLGNRDLISYLKDHKYRLFPKRVSVRIAECLSPTTILLKSSLTTKYVITEEAKRTYAAGNEDLYNELSEF